MSTAIAKQFQVGSDSTATNNFTIRQPATPDGTVRIANGNSGTTTDLVTVTSAGNVGVGTSSPATKFQVSAGRTTLSANNENFALQLNNGSSTNGPFLGSSGLDTLVVSASSGAERMRLDSSGNLGIGVTPSAWASQPAIQQTGGALWGINAANYEVLQNAFYNGTNYIYRNTNLASRYNQNAGVHSWFTAPSGTAGNAISFTQAMTLDASGNLQLGATSGSGNRLNVVGSGGIRVNEDGSGTKVITIRSDFAGVGPAINVTTNDPLLFQTNNTERARITSGGNFGLGTTNPVYRMQVQANATTYAAVFQNQNASPYGLYINHNGASPNNAGNEFIICWDTTATRFRVNSNGGIENYQANNVNLSDRREKTNFAPAGDYLSKICAIPVQTFNYIDQNMEEDPGLTLGVVAQDVQSVAPELVSESNLGTKEDPKMRLSIYQTDLQYALMKCIQELKAELDSVKTELALLKGTA